MSAMLMPVYVGNPDSWKSVWLKIVLGLILASLFYDKLLDKITISTSKSLVTPKRQYYVPKNLKSTQNMVNVVPEMVHIPAHDSITSTETSKTTNIKTTTIKQTTTTPTTTTQTKTQTIYTPRAKIKLPSIVPGNLPSPDSKLLCPLDRHEINLESITPKKNLHHDRYILNLSPFGPNNQIRGFRDTIVLAIYLNRTIIMPPWYRHEFDPALKRITGKRDRDLNYRDFSDLMDVEELAKFVTVLPFSALKEVCPDGMDAAFFARDPVSYHTWYQMNSYEHLSNVSITRNLTYEEFEKNPGGVAKKISVLPKDLRKNPHTAWEESRDGTEQIFVDMSASAMFSSYGTRQIQETCPCAMWVMPFRNIFYWSKYLNDKAMMYVKRPVERVRIAMEMLNSTRRPKQVQNFAKKFIEQVMSTKSFLSVHWRYDRRDFGGHCRKGKSGEYRKACKALKHGGFNATSLAQNLISFIKENQDNLDKQENTENTDKQDSSPLIKHIYFAATPQDAKLVREIKGNVTVFDSEMRFFGHDELDEFIKKEYQECEADRMKLQIHDFFSQVEMEICRESTIFMNSDSSSWSVAVQYERDVLHRSDSDKPNRVLFD